ncbi:MAG: hypothetical protein K2Q18_02055 [Bdellovibrionales bacterium]|nr:hypothetical protein [Bdellovibrionales bacterium]
MINQLYSYYPTYTPKYKFADICTGTCASSYTALPMELYSSSGIGISAVATKQLVFNLAVSATSTTPVGQTCTDSAQCTAIGYDCCSSGQCVSDLSLRPGVDPSSPTAEYAQALQDILNNPSNIYLYPQFYFICSQPTNTPTTPTSPTTPEADAAARLIELNELYACTNKVEGEYGICTITHKNAVITNYGDDRDYRYSGLDDRSFSDTFTHLTVNKQSLVGIEQISYGGIIVYDYSLKAESDLIQSIYEDTTLKIEGNQNDDITSAAKVKMKVKPASATSNDLKIKYKIDASCTKVSSVAAKCEKYYIQDQGSPSNELGVSDAVKRQRRVTNHYPTSNIFKLPYYANTSRAITVEVDGITQRLGIDWQLTVGTQNTVEFLPVNTLKVAKDQKVRITYFVDLTAYPNVMKSKLEAIAKINTKCTCTGIDCGLVPIKNASGAITDYACLYPEPTPVDPPMSQTIFLSSKAMPIRLFDNLGTSKKSISSSITQEGTAFKYRGDNLLNPNNQPDITNSGDTSDTYIGFNEIYGSLSYSNNSAKPAQEVTVKKNTTYDIYVAQGAYSNCTQCGNDYYSNLTKLFPLTQFGGGMVPMIGQTNRSMSSGIRADEMKFGRACLVPATMLPWSHATYSKEQDQRLNRMNAQHFLYANGYQYDWYGFDYGSVIGSFDGVKWFSIGSNRRIKSDTGKLFIAVNGIFGDLSVENTYQVTINDATLNPSTTNIVQTDYASDGAQCQQYHQCSTDNDCAATLGWEYACAPIGEITTSWPVFDENAKEVPEAVSDKVYLTSILNVASSGKRCVYRGRGALCTPNYASVNLNSTFNKTSSQTMHSCSDNTYCQTINTSGTLSPNFNNRIARYGKVKSDSTVDTFGLGSIIPGRPLKYQGQEPVRATTVKNLNVNKITAMCLPGRDVEKTNYLDQNMIAPTTTGSYYTGDKVTGIGMTLKKGSTVAQPNYLAACSITDTSKNFYRNTTTSAAGLFTNTSIYPNLQYDSGSQAISTNALNVFNSLFTTQSMTLGIYKANNVLLTSAAFTENRCLRAPGASCFSDMDCAPSKLISDKIKLLNSEDSALQAIINKYEIKFWQEELVCSQATAKTDALYDPKNNRCCREVGNVISLPAADLNNKISYKKVPGIDLPMSVNVSSVETAGVGRYSRSASMYKELNTNATTYPDIKVAVANQCTGVGCATLSSLDYQYRSIAALAEKTSCSGDWVRSFNTTSTNSHKWEVSRLQNYAASNFQCFNWYPGSGAGFTCADYDEEDPNCPVVQTPPTALKAKEILSYLGKLELTGIPQIAFEEKAFFEQANAKGLSCTSYPGDRTHAYPTNQSAPSGTYSVAPNIYSATTNAEYTDGSTFNWLSGSDPTNFASTIKQVFKPDEIVSCLEAGTQMKAGDDPAKCCTGVINTKTLKCQLNDFIDVSLYTNRYVSSEAKKLNASLFDKEGYIKDPALAANLACQKQMCASGYLAYGILISKLKVPGQEDSENKYFRFMEGNTKADDENGLLGIYNKGLKLNTHIYCLPEKTATQSNVTEDITIIKCGN